MAVDYSAEEATGGPTVEPCRIAQRRGTLGDPACQESATFDICQAILAPGGRLANVGVHRTAVVLHLETLWDRNITLTTRLVDTVTTPMLLAVVGSGQLQSATLVTHRFALDEVMKACDTLGNAAKEGALKVQCTSRAGRQ